MSNRSRDAWRLAHALRAKTHVGVEVEWDGSSRWCVQWQGGPTMAAMRQLVEQLVPLVAPSLASVPLDWFRGLPGQAWARALLRAHHAGTPITPIGGGNDLVTMRWELDATSYPELPADDAEAEWMRRLLRATRRGDETDMANLLARYGLSALGEGDAPAGVVSIEERRRNRQPGV
jgi:hypothetical protein